MPYEPPKTPPFWRSASALMWLIAVAVGGFYLVTEHQAHLFGALPFLVLLACPLMHLFMHRGHGHGRRDEKHGSHGDGQHPQ